MRAAVQAVLLPRRDPEPRRAGDARVDPRGRRARLLAVPRLRRGVRQPGPGRGGGRRRRRGGDRSAGDQLAQHQVRRPGARRRGAADPAPQRLQDRQPHRAGPDPRGGAATCCCAATATRRTSSPATTPRPCTRPSPPPWTAASTRSADIQRGGPAPAGPTGAAAPWPMIVLRTPEGLDRPEGGRRRAGSRATGAPTRCPSPTPATTSAPARSWRSGCAATGPRSCSTTTGAPVAGDPRPAPAPATRRMSANPHANGGLLLRDLRLPDFREYAVDGRRDPGTGAVEATRVLGTFLRDVMARNADRFRVFSPGREQLQPAPGRPGGHRPHLERRDPALRRPPRPRRPGDGDPLRAHLPGLARGLPADRPARVLLLLRGVHPHRRLDVQPARQVAGDHATASRGAGRSRR